MPLEEFVRNVKRNLAPLIFSDPVYPAENMQNRHACKMKVEKKMNRKQGKIKIQMQIFEKTSIACVPEVAQSTAVMEKIRSLFCSRYHSRGWLTVLRGHVKQHL